MDLRAVLADFPGVRPLAGLRDAWYWSRVPLFGLAGALSADGERLLQLSGRGSYDEELAVAVLGFAREREGELFARNAHWGAIDGFQPPAGRRDFDFDSVIGISPDVHRAYPVEHPELTPHVRMVFPAYACEFAAAGDETLDEAITENRHGRVWRMEWRDGWLMAEYGQAPREVGVEEAVEFAMARLYGRAVEEGEWL
ncbi:hypothetical protein [Streptomyces justiciae]|uniref:hypothetical protein n=1 Tax=Streptomyces justiciae TaxID=2780140 RepID=UPI0021186E39|nr:hypothetical protein [Streptomyces justiciae]MCW8384227.1 hypothetical protein [Streptomyces justiciae]